MSEEAAGAEMTIDDDSDTIMICMTSSLHA